MYQRTFEADAENKVNLAFGLGSTVYVEKNQPGKPRSRASEGGVSPDWAGPAPI